VGLLVVVRAFLASCVYSTDSQINLLLLLLVLLLLLRALDENNERSV